MNEIASKSKDSKFREILFRNFSDDKIEPASPISDFNYSKEDVIETKRKGFIDGYKSGSIMGFAGGCIVMLAIGMAIITWVF
jgi:hypothetical protein